MINPVGIRKPSRRLAIRLLFAAALASGAALIVPHLGRGSAHSSPIDLSHRAEIANIATGAGPAALYVAPAVDGNECVSVALPDLAGATPGDLAAENGGATCSPKANIEQRLTGNALTSTMSWVPESGASNDVALVIEGRAGAAIKTVALEMPDGSTVPASLSDTVGGFYVSRITAPAVGQLPGAVSVIGYDASGAEVANVDLQALLAASTPH